MHLPQLSRAIRPTWLISLLLLAKSTLHMSIWARFSDWKIILISFISQEKKCWDCLWVGPRSWVYPRSAIVCKFLGLYWHRSPGEYFPTWAKTWFTIYLLCFIFLVNKSKEDQLKGQATQTHTIPTYNHHASGDKVVNGSAFESPILDANSEEEGSQSITSNIRQLLPGKIDISLKENTSYHLYINSSIVDDPDTKAKKRKELPLFLWILMRNIWGQRKGVEVKIICSMAYNYISILICTNGLLWY